MPMKQERLQVGIIGLGPLTYAHQQGVTESPDIAALAALCDIDLLKAQDRAAMCGEPRCYTDYRELLKDRDVDTVFIMLPHHLHYEVARTCLEHSKHVLMEKPLTIVAREGLELIELAKKKGLTFMVAENTRFMKAYIEAEKLLREERLGRIMLVRTFIAGTEVHRMRDASNWKGRKQGSGGGVIMDSGPHTFYLLKWLFGGIRDVQTYAEKLTQESEVEDNTVMVGHLADGGLFTSQVSFTVEAPWTERLEIYGSTGSLIIDQLCNPPALFYAGEEDFYPKSLPDVPFDNILWKYYSVVDEVKSFLNSVYHHAPPEIDPLDAYYAIVAVEKAYESLALGRPVAVPGLKEVV